ncbi:K+-transporting ATPase ATPase C chain [Auraticoccus monumenti]|uniref:Potassium-transporting ATPase KdpC subunit n=1 Tax=Auraticoccus monumenti TaxID=675864 RepID=A0A1G6RMU7_9ACTN|nr:K+-transporting ATPase ATPase C chain [Auraticoccus monumenti]
MNALLRSSLAGLRLLVVLTLLLGLAYPLLVLGVGRLLAPERAVGSLVEVDGRVVGSELLGQPFDGPGWFWGRPSAAGDGYDGLASSGSNAGPNDADLVADIAGRQATLAGASGVSPADVPADAVTASASGLDPDVSPEWAELQVPRVAAERGLGEAQVRAVVADATRGRPLGVLGEPRVNVLLANAGLERLG